MIPAASSGLLWESLRRSRARVERVVGPGDHLHGIGDPQVGPLMELVGRWVRYGTREGSSWNSGRIQP
jgi:hypothetical protein